MFCGIGRTLCGGPRVRTEAVGVNYWHDPNDVGDDDRFETWSMASLNGQTLFTSFLSGEGNRRKYGSDLLGEVDAKKVVLTIVTIGGRDPSSNFDVSCAAFAGIEGAYRSAVDVIFSQMDGLFSSIELGL